MNDKSLGSVIFAFGIIGSILYVFWLLLVVVGIFFIAMWIGWTMAVTPPPVIEGIETTEKDKT